jgi:uncharacterized protein (DUF983 family)
MKKLVVLIVVGRLIESRDVLNPASWMHISSWALIFILFSSHQVSGYHL